MIKKTAFIKFARPLPWKEAELLRLGLSVTYVTKAGESGVVGVYCYPTEQEDVRRMLRKANVELS